MRVLVTGSAGHLGEGLVRRLREESHEVAALDRLESRFTDHVGSILEPGLVRRAVRGADIIMHAATLHKPHMATHSRREFVETNIAGTLNILEAALEAGVSAVVLTSTTSTFGAALTPPEAEPAAWITEEVTPVPRTIYGVTKKAAEDLCEMFYRQKGLPCVVLRTSRFFPEADDDPALRRDYEDLNLKVNEYLYRRLDLADAVDAHRLAAERAPQLGFRRYVVSATTPFETDHLSRLRTDAPGVVASLFPEYEEEYARRGWKMIPGIDRVYVNRRAREELSWKQRFGFHEVLGRLRRGEDVFSPLARAVGIKGYHDRTFEDGPYPVEGDREAGG